MAMTPIHRIYFNGATPENSTAEMYRDCLSLRIACIWALQNAHNYNTLTLYFLPEKGRPVKVGRFSVEGILSTEYEMNGHQSDITIAPRVFWEVACALGHIVISGLYFYLSVYSAAETIRGKPLD